MSQDEFHANKRFYLEVIQRVIERLAGNSFKLKEWAVIATIAILGIAVENHNPWLALLAMLPAVAFGLLDAFFLRQERLFKELYAQVAEQTEGDISFSMDTRQHERSVSSIIATATFNQSPKDADGKKAGPKRSNTILCFYLPIVLVILACSVGLYCASQRTW